MKNHLPPFKTSNGLTTNPDKERKLNARDIKNLFEALNAIYGHTFASQVQDERAHQQMLQTWKAALDGLTVGDMDDGLMYCRRKYLEKYAPTCAIFRSFCRKVAKETKANDGFHRASPEFIEAYEKKYGKVVRSRPAGDGYHQETPKEATRKCFEQWESLGVDVPALPEFDELLRVAEVDAADYVRLYSHKPAQERASVEKRQEQTKRKDSPGYKTFREFAANLAKKHNIAT